jgi:CRISPR/Cas system CSM-associated protein Csm3 (group 7 of RAMP superfamily)
MLINRLCFSAQIKGLSEVLISSDSVVRDETGEHLITPVLRGYGNKPMIPASTLKGALRAYNCDNASLRDLFGFAAADGTTKSAIGRLELDDACLVDTTRVTSIRRTAISRQTGAADHNRLFQQEAVQPGGVFSFEGRLFYKAGERDLAVRQLGVLLAPLWQENQALMLGHGVKTGAGRFVLYQQPKLTVWELDEFSGSWPGSGVSVDWPVDLENTHSCASSDAYVTFSLKLSSETPFAVVDGHNEIGEGPNLTMRKDGDIPVMPATSVYGVLRSRAAWLASCSRLKSNAERSDIDLDDRFLENKLGGAIKDLREDMASLTPMERVFGVSGFRGLLAIVNVKCTEKGVSQILQMVSIDRFTGGAREGALFSMESQMDTCWTVNLSFDRSRAKAVYKHSGMSDEECVEAMNCDLNLINELVQDLQNNGVMIGNSTSSGMGWFDVFSDSSILESGEFYG